MTHEEFYATIGGKGLKCDKKSMRPHEGGWVPQPAGFFSWVTGVRCARCGYDPAIHEAFEFKPQPELAMTFDELETFIDLAHMLGNDNPFAFKDSREMPTAVRAWGDEFNKRHKHSAWGIDTDYLYEIDKFFCAKLASL